MASIGNGHSHQASAEYTDVDVEEKFVRVGNVLTHTIQLGHLEEANGARQRYLFLLIPGNPGVPKYYEDFMRELYNQSRGQIPVWAIGQAGHTRPPGKSLTAKDVVATDESTYGLQAQIDHKVTFIKEQVPPDVKLILIGHSIGCYMILNSLEKLTPESVHRCFLLFPTIERMAVSPNGTSHTPILRYFRWILVLMAFFIILLPESVRVQLIAYVYRKFKYPDCMIPAILTTLTPWTVNFSTYLAKLEMGLVTELQKDLIKKHLGKLSLYYGASDLWTPVQYFNEMVTEFPAIDAQLCELDMKHAFVMVEKEGQQMAEILWQWLKLRQIQKTLSNGVKNGEMKHDVS